MQASATIAKSAAGYGSPRPAAERFSTLDLLIKIIVPLGLIVSFWVALEMGFLQNYAALFSFKTYQKPLMAVGAAYTLGFLIFQVMRTYFWWRYRPFSLPPGPLPKVTVLIPAYNEGAMVEKALYSVAASDYPADRLEIICIDDGSKTTPGNICSGPRRAARTSSVDPLPEKSWQAGGPVRRVFPGHRGLFRQRRFGQRHRSRHH